MNLLDRMIANLFEKRFHPSQDPPENWLRGRGMETASGVDITPESSLCATAVYACVRVLAESVAVLPLGIFERLDNGGKQKAVSHRLFTLLHELPNPEMTSFTLRETLMGHLCLWGNALCEIERDQGGNVLALWPLRPDRVSLKRENGQLRYYIEMPAGIPNAILSSDRVWHIPGLGFNGLWGLSPIAQERQAIGLSLATEEYGARFFGNGASPGGVLEHPGQLSDEAHRRMRTDWEDMHSGLTNAHRIAILEEGVQYKQVGINPEDAQFLDTRKYQATEIARIFRVPPHMIGDLDRATFSNIEQQSIDFVTNSLTPWLVRWEQSISKNMLTSAERKKYFPKFNVNGLLRGDTLSRYQSYAVARNNGWMSANDIRELEDQNPIDGGDEYLVPLNMIPAGSDSTPTNSTDQGTRSLLRLPDFEQRAASSAANRRKLMLTYRTVYEDLEGRILRREVNDLVNGANKIFKQRSYTDFLNWLDQFFEKQSESILRDMLASVQAYADLVADEAAREVGGEVDPDWLQRFVRRYLRAYAARHIEASRAAVEKILEQAQSEGTNPAEALEAGISDWPESRAKTLAQEESVRTNGAVSVEAYLMAGAAFLVWRNYGDSCPYCQSLNGRKVAISEWFLKAGEEFKPDGADAALTLSRNVKHPPAHKGCDCMIGAGL